MKRTAGGAACGTPKNVWLPTRPAVAVSRTPGHRTAPDGPMRTARAHFRGGRRQSCPPNLWWLPESSRYPARSRICSDSK
jgi:hypothetical protein